MTNPPLEWEVLQQYQKIGFALIHLDHRGSIVECTNAFAAMIGRDRQETIGQSIIAITAPEFRTTARQRIAVAREGRFDHFATEKAYLLPDGRRVWCSLESVRSDSQHLLSVIRKLSDTDSSKRLAELESQRDEIAQKLDQVQEKMYALMIAVAQQKNAIDVNVIHGGQNNIGDNEIAGDQLTHE